MGNIAKYYRPTLPTIKIEIPQNPRENWKTWPKLQGSNNFIFFTFFFYIIKQFQHWKLCRSLEQSRDNTLEGNQPIGDQSINKKPE